MKINLGLLLGMVLVASLRIAMAADADVSKLAAANNNFSFKLLRQLVGEQAGKSVFVSPYSVATALQMVANGGAGRTRSEMEQALETTNLSTAELSEATKFVAGLLSSNNTNLILSTANALWYRQGTTLKTDFAAANQKYFQATIKALDFDNPAAAEAAINQWASDQTHGRITGIADGTVTPATDLILANAIYFKGKWVDPFDPAQTKDRPFHAATGADTDVPMMQMSETFMYRKGSSYQAVRLPYMGGDLAMYVFLPDPGSSPAKLLKIMNGDKWRRVTMPGFSGQPGMVVLPKFKLETTMELSSSLNDLGIKTAFSRSADFSGMFNDAHRLSEVRQKAFVEVNEQGTEAAAVTEMQVEAAGIEMPPPKPFEMIVDRPFLFAIVDDRSEMILFMGVVNEL